MRFLIFLFLIFFFASILEAEYIRSIRLGTYVTEKQAKDALQKVETFIAKYPNIKQQQRLYNFIFKERKSGNYFIVLAEPFQNRKVLQEVLDTLRLGYPDSYVKKIKSLSEVRVDSSLSFITPAPITKTISKPIKQVVKVIVKKEKVQSLIPKKTLTKEKLEKVNSASYEYNYFYIFIIPLIFLLFIMVFLTFSYRKKLRFYKEKQFIIDEKYSHIRNEIQNREQLLAYISHELRSPMTAITGLVNLVLESDLTRLQQDCLQKIEKNSDYMLMLLNDVLDFSKIQVGKLEIEKKEFNINDIVNYVFNVISVRTKYNNLNILVNVAQDVPSRLIGDSLRLGQVLINLMGNSIKFTKEGKITLAVRKIENIGKYVKLEFSISDTGIGMSNDEVKNLFISYPQVNSSVSTESGSIGLGLAISKNLVELMGGTIRVKSKKGVGSTFSFTVLFTLKDSQNKRQYRLPSGKLLHKKILLVDSFNQNAIPLMEAFSYFNYKVEIISSVDYIQKDFDNFPYDILIVNLHNLKEQAINEIKQIKNKFNIKFVILSELHSSLNESHLKRLLIDAYLKPPFTIQIVLNLILELYMDKEKNNFSQENRYITQLKQFAAKKILVAEDNELIQKVILEMLVKSGIEVSFVLDGEEVLKLLKSGLNFNLILMDINMPQLNGYETTMKIREDSKYNQLPILALSADCSEEAIRKSKESGMQGHLAKPIDLDEFYTNIIDALKNNTIHMREDDEEFYHNLMEDFTKMYKNAPADFKMFLENDNLEKAKVLARDIKDVSLSLGEYKLAEQVALLEYTFEKKQKERAYDALSIFEVSLQKFIL